MPYPYEDIVPGGWHALMPLVKKRVCITNMVIYHTLHEFIAYEWRLLKDIVELLDSPYSAVAAADTIEPVTGVPYTKLKEGQMLTEWYSFEGTADLTTATVTQTSYVHDPETREPVAVPYRRLGTYFLSHPLDGDPVKNPNCSFKYDRSSMDIRDVTARSMEQP
jgi:hypothetical protein